ncbi:hypothetical protein ACOSQ2_026569 [Xanthoceras sorbifolium]
MEVCIISREIIKPSSPTPPHLRTYKLSLLDQLNFDESHFPVILFYSSKTCENTTKVSDNLKTSLAETLTHYYPFAGRVKDKFSIDCDDSGAVFIEANVDSNMSEILKRHEYDQLAQLQPFNDNSPCTDERMVVIQVNHFSCGGVAICVCFKYVLADGKAAANFIRSWSAVACGDNYAKNANFDCSTVFPPQDLQLQDLWKCFEQNVSYGEAIGKRFTIDGTKIAALREKIRDGGQRLHWPTRFEAVSALIWGATMAAARERDDVKQTNVAFVPMNMEKRLNRSLSEQCFSHMCLSTIVKWPMEKAMDYNTISGKVHESIMMVDDNYVRKINEGGGFLDDLRNLNEESSKLNVCFISSWCKFSLYEADFGWGKPAWAGTFLKCINLIVLSDTCDSDGIEAWVVLSEQDMARFEENPNILAYASPFKPSI